MTLVQIVRIPADGIETFQSFEAKVLPLLPKYGARLDRRLRSIDGQVEVHVMTFPSREALDRYREDPVRVGALPLLDASGSTSELIELRDVNVG